MHWLCPLYYMGVKFGPSDKRIKKKLLTSVEIKFFRKTVGYTLFDHEINEKIVKALKVETMVQIYQIIRHQNSFKTLVLVAALKTPNVTSRITTHPSWKFQ
jgi:hypothetical protein